MATTFCGVAVNRRRKRVAGCKDILRERIATPHLYPRPHIMQYEYVVTAPAPALLVHYLSSPRLLRGACATAQYVITVAEPGVFS